MESIACGSKSKYAREIITLGPFKNVFAWKSIFFSNEFRKPEAVEFEVFMAYSNFRLCNELLVLNIDDDYIKMRSTLAFDASYSRLFTPLADLHHQTDVSAPKSMLINVAWFHD